MGSVLTTATMKSASRGPLRVAGVAAAAGAGPLAAAAGWAGLVWGFLAGAFGVRAGRLGAGLLVFDALLAGLPVWPDWACAGVARAAPRARDTE